MKLIVFGSAAAIGVTLIGVTWLVCSARYQLVMRALRLELKDARAIKEQAIDQMNQAYRSEAALRTQLHYADDRIADLERKLARYQRKRGPNGRFEASSHARSS